MTQQVSMNPACIDTVHSREEKRQPIRLARNLDDLRRLVQKLTKRGVRIGSVHRLSVAKGRQGLVHSGRRVCLTTILSN